MSSKLRIEIKDFDDATATHGRRCKMRVGGMVGGDTTRHVKADFVLQILENVLLRVDKDDLKKSVEKNAQNVSGEEKEFIEDLLKHL